MTHDPEAAELLLEAIVGMSLWLRNDGYTTMANECEAVAALIRAQAAEIERLRATSQPDADLLGDAEWIASIDPQPEMEQVLSTFAAQQRRDPEIDAIISEAIADGSLYDDGHTSKPDADEDDELNRLADVRSGGPFISVSQPDTDEREAVLAFLKDVLVPWFSKNRGSVVADTVTDALLSRYRMVPRKQEDE